MEKMNLEQVKAIELEILDFIDSVCKEYDITYYLAGGTFLGAVRHQGFIPWDDDIDLIMPRKDYKRFIKAVNDKKTKYKALSGYTDLNYRKKFVKVVDTDTVLIEHGLEKMERLGIYVDVFPLDNLPNDKDKRRKMQKTQHLCICRCCFLLYPSLLSHMYSTRT